MKRVISATVGVLLVTVCAAAHAQGLGTDPDDEVRFEETVTRVAGARGVSVHLRQRKNTSGWQLRLVDRTARKVIGTTNLPEWAGAAYYKYDVTVRRVGTASVVMFEASPNPEVDGPAGAESFQVAWAHGTRRGQRAPVWVEIGSTRTSPLDGGDRLVFRKEGGEDALVRLRESEQTRFCGADLAAFQIFNPDELSFRSRVDLETLAKNSEQIVAEVPAEDVVDLRYPRFALWFSATSDRFNAGDSSTTIRPLELGDDQLNTAWMEGVAGLGRGEFVTARINEALKMRGLRIAAGHFASAEQYAAHAKPRRVLLSFEDGTRFAAELPAARFEDATAHQGHVIWFPRPMSSNCLSVVLLDATRGNPTDPVDAWKANAVAISELAPISELYGLEADVAALVVVEKLLKDEDLRSARQLVRLTTPLANELVAVLQTVLDTGTDADRVRVVPLLRSLPSQASVPLLVEMFEQAEPTDDVYMSLKPVIAAHREIAAPHLLEILKERPPTSERKLTDLTRLIGRLGTADQLKVLLDELGDGPSRLRHERVRAIAAGSEAMLPALFAVARDATDTPRGEDALQAINAIGRRLHFRGQGSTAGSVALLQVADKAELRRTILQTMRALGYFNTEGAIELLADFAGHAPDPLLRKQAVESLARYPEREARASLAAALLDESPDVRIAAIGGLSQREDRRQVLSAIERYIARETWTPGLEVAYGIVAELGDEQLITQMTARIAQDPSSDHATIAAEALTRAKRSLPPALAEQVLFTPDTSVLMRRNLIDSLGVGEQSDAERVLLRVIDAPVPFADLQPRQNDRMRQRAILALGRRDSEAGRVKLMQLVADGSATNDMRAVALRGLAFSRETKLVAQLESMRPDAPNELQGAFAQTIELINRRASIAQLADDIAGEVSEEADE